MQESGLAPVITPIHATLELLERCRAFVLQSIVNGSTKNILPGFGDERLSFPDVNTLVSGSPPAKADTLVEIKGVDVRAIEGIEPQDMLAARHCGCELRFLAELRIEAEATVLRVGPTFVPKTRNFTQVSVLEDSLAEMIALQRSTLPQKQRRAHYGRMMFAGNHPQPARLTSIFQEFGVGIKSVTCVSDTVQVFTHSIVDTQIYSMMHDLESCGLVGLTVIPMLVDADRIREVDTTPTLETVVRRQVVARLTG